MAFLKGSRYEGLARFDEGAPFRGIRPRPLSPATPIVEHAISLKDRPDQLAQEYYRQPRAWIRLAEANLRALFPEDLLWSPDPPEENGRERLGDVILIPGREEEG